MAISNLINMTRESGSRPSSCRHYLIIALLTALILILAYKYWSVASINSELLVLCDKEVYELTKRLNVSNDERTKATAAAAETAATIAKLKASISP